MSDLLNYPADFCVGCLALGKQLNVSIDFKHRYADCPRQSTVIKMLKDDAPDKHTTDVSQTLEDGKHRLNLNQKPPTLML